MTARRRWTSEEKEYVLAHWKEMSDADLGAATGHPISSVNTLRQEMDLFRDPSRCRPGGKKSWSVEDEAYLMDKWGTVSIPAIAKHLERTVTAVKVRAVRLGLGPVLMGGPYVTFNQLMLTLTDNSQSYSYQMVSWVKNRGMPIHTKRVDRCTWRIVYLDEFWEWAEKHRSFIDFSKLEPLALGAEPEWVAQQRKIDAVSFANQRKDPWTPQEDQRLQHLLEQHKYTWSEMSKELRRSAGAIQRRCCDLGLKVRPVRGSPHNPWSEEHLQLMADMIRQGYSYTMIGDACGGRSEKAVRGVVYQKYQTENMDKVRTMLQDGPWGHGAPEPTVKSAKHKESVRKPMAQLCALLLVRRNSMEWGEYWQRDLCQHWDDVRGCLMRCSDCDSCTKFQRIRPQYCRMCGGEFLERREQTYCTKCRAMRKKQAQRKYAVLHKRGWI